MKFLSDFKYKDLQNKICLLRVDLNIENENIQKDNLRILSILPTIKFLISRGVKLVILSHRGRPEEKLQIKIQKFNKFSLRPFAKILSFLLRKPVDFISFNELGLINKTKQKIQKAKQGSVFLAENLRLFPEEEKNDAKFAENLASLGDFYINDAFSVSHRKNASVVAITKYLPSYAGLLLEKEIKNLDKIRGLARKRGLIIVLGGAKISDKIVLLNNFQKLADYFLIGGGIANTMFAGQGLPIGESLYESKMAPFAERLLKSLSKKIILPKDVIIDKRKILDIGPKTIEKYKNIIKKAKTIIWNGPMGYFENPKFAKGSQEIGKAIMANKKAFAVIGGGETISVVSSVKCQASRNMFVSTGGGAMLEYLAGKKLPGIKALK